MLEVNVPGGNLLDLSIEPFLLVVCRRFFVRVMSGEVFDRTGSWKENVRFKVPFCGDA